ncbi:RluA family pseudouridine synthase [Radiobacillus kanasensis]|uniref:RluA family pseudouridine synthase n=1 Tax=Radiobacillus kanasensis TaxID=2844358 RepID=UPI001E4D5C14|nr:RluA family pseudouridine synthase [Radiobacillus kanasensis]UFU00583.1 RluA family pseudouridine synthase [Radiobacillus kanasensis]
MKWSITKEHDSMLVRDFLHQVCGLSRRIIKVLKFQGGSILVDGAHKDVRHKLQEGETIQIIFPPEARGPAMVAERLPIEIVYEDEDVLVINKPAGIATIPSVNHTSGTIANRLLGYYDEQNLQYTVHIVTRLDRDTSGLLLVAKHRLSHSILSRDQKLGAVNRSYYAIVEGQLQERQSTIDLPIGRKEDSIIQRAVLPDGQQAITHYEVEQEMADETLVSVRLQTGRTHQIRVHFSHLGHPLLGDDLYGGDLTKMKRQALHCKSLAFNQPFSGERITLGCDMPGDMASLLKEKVFDHK